MVFPVVMYGCESCTVKKAERRRIDAFVSKTVINRVLPLEAAGSRGFTGRAHGLVLPLPSRPPLRSSPSDGQTCKEALLVLYSE